MRARHGIVDCGFQRLWDKLTAAFRANSFERYDKKILYANKCQGTKNPRALSTESELI
mgnify:CR=1 FL=1